MLEYLLHETQNIPFYREKSLEDTKCFSSLQFTEFFNLNYSQQLWSRLLINKPPPLKFILQMGSCLTSYTMNTLDLIAQLLNNRTFNNNNQRVPSVLLSLKIQGRGKNFYITQRNCNAVFKLSCLIFFILIQYSKKKRKQIAFCKCEVSGLGFLSAQRKIYWLRELCYNQDNKLSQNCRYIQIESQKTEQHYFFPPLQRRSFPQQIYHM